MRIVKIKLKMASIEISSFLMNFILNLVMLLISLKNCNINPRKNNSSETPAKMVKRINSKLENLS